MSALDRFRAGDETESDVRELATEYARLHDPTLVTEENLRAEGFEYLDDPDANTMWLLGVGQQELDVCFCFRTKTIELEAMPIRRGKVTIGDVRMLLKALGHKA
jgi:hypothetical protein